jgi:hypothetical protein
MADEKNNPLKKTSVDEIDLYREIDLAEED